MTVADLLDALGDSQPRSSVELQADLAISQAAVSRLVSKAGNRVLRLGAGRSTRYTVAVDVFGVQSEASLFEVSGTGVVREFGSLRQTGTGRYVVTGDDLPFWALGTRGNGWFADLPYFLADLRPAGFLGRLTARRLAPALAAPDDPRAWTSDQIGQYLLRSGTDLPGNLVLGERAAEAANRAVLSTVRDRASRYPEMVQRNLDEEPPGSSAAGEQPKFLAYVEGPGHVIVKYSDTDDGPLGKRWSDLLAAEHRALGTLADNGLPAADASLCRFAGRTYLECRRFDRVGEHGRCPSISLGLVDAEFLGAGSRWSRIAEGLRSIGLLDQASCEQIVWLETFGHWIGNTDMHPGNLSLRPGVDSFALLPVYDMLPMRLARSSEALDSIDLPPPIRRPTNEAAWEASGRIAQDFWGALSDDMTLSDAFRRFADRYARRWLDLLRSDSGSPRGSV